jgi:dihydrolipoamide dehydrogenase
MDHIADIGVDPGRFCASLAAQLVRRVLLVLSICCDAHHTTVVSLITAQSAFRSAPRRRRVGRCQERRRAVEVAPMQYDVVVIGSGPGGYVAAIRAAHLGLRTALVEKDGKLGGTCLLRGCIPTKALLHSADLLTEFKHAKDFGITLPGPAEIDVAGVQRARAKVVERSSAGVAYLMKQNKIEVHTGRGRLADAHTVLVEKAAGETARLETKNIIVATGSVPRELPFLKIDRRRIVTSDEMLELTAVPKSLLVLGAGAVGVEFASIYSRFGSDTTLVEMLDRLLPIEDAEVSAEIERAFRKRGITCLTSTKLEKAEVAGERVVASLVDKEGAAQTLEVDMVLVAIGRAPVTADLGLDELGIKRDKGGYVEVDKLMRTAVPHIYAIGDIVRTPWLAHVASAEGILAVDHIAGRQVQPLKYRNMPSCTYCEPQVASAGYSEAAAREAGYEVKVGKFPFSALGKARILGANEGFVKVVADAKFDEVLGVHMVGPSVTELIAEACVALQLEATSEELAHTVHAHPTLSEAVGEAAHGALGRPLHL